MIPSSEKSSNVEICSSFSQPSTEKSLSTFGINVSYATREVGIVTAATPKHRGIQLYPSSNHVLSSGWVEEWLLLCCLESLILCPLCRVLSFKPCWVYKARRKLTLKLFVKLLQSHGLTISSVATEQSNPKGTEPPLTHLNWPLRERHVFGSGGIRIQALSHGLCDFRHRATFGAGIDLDDNALLYADMIALVSQPLYIFLCHCAGPTNEPTLDVCK